VTRTLIPKQIALKKPVLIFFLLISFAFSALAQQQTDTSFRNQAVNHLIQLYYQAVGHQAELYTSPVYDQYLPPITEGSPYFLTDSFSLGTIAYSGLIYQQVPLLYDMVRDEVVLRNPAGFSIALIKEKIDSFSFSGHSFIKFKKSVEADINAEEFYEQLYSGSIKLLAKKRKSIQEILGTSVTRKINSRTQYFIVRDGQFLSVKNKSSLLSVLKNKRNELQQFIKNNNLRFKENVESDMAQVVAYYDQIL